jgi:predicted dehydrogenase
MDISKILVIGHGSTGIRHLTNLVSYTPSNIEVACVRRSMDRPFKLIHYMHIDDAIKWNPDAVFITTPTENHIDYIRLFSDKHIFVEKPAIKDKSSFSFVKEMVLNSNKVFQVGFNLRYHPHVASIKTLIRYYAPEYIEWIHSDYLPKWHPWEEYKTTYPAKDGVSLTLSHGIDILMYIFGDISITDKKTYHNLDIEGDSFVEATINIGDIPGRYTVRMDSEERSCILRISTKSSEYAYDFYSSMFPRNETFVREMLAFLHKCDNNDVSENAYELQSMEKILQLCQE